MDILSIITIQKYKNITEWKKWLYVNHAASELGQKKIICLMFICIYHNNRIAFEIYRL